MPNTFETMFGPAPEPATELGRYRVLSSTAGVRVSPLCLGAMSIGEAWSDVCLIPTFHTGVAYPIELLPWILSFWSEIVDSTA